MKKLVRVKVGTEGKILKSHYGGPDYMGYTGFGVSVYPGKLKNMIATLNNFQKEYRDKYQDLEFDMIRDCGCYNECSCDPSLVLYGKRYETEVEYDWRLKQETAAETNKLAREKAEYEKLKAKFENG